MFQANNNYKHGLAGILNLYSKWSIFIFPLVNCAYSLYLAIISGDLLWKTVMGTTQMAISIVDAILSLLCAIVAALYFFNVIKNESLIKIGFYISSIFGIIFAAIQLSSHNPPSYFLAKSELLSYCQTFSTQNQAADEWLQLYNTNNFEAFRKVFDRTISAYVPLKMILELWSVLLFVVIITDLFITKNKDLVTISKEAKDE